MSRWGKSKGFLEERAWEDEDRGDEEEGRAQVQDRRRRPVRGHGEVLGGTCKENGEGDGRRRGFSCIRKKNTSSFSFSRDASSSLCFKASFLHIYETRR